MPSSLEGSLARRPCSCLSIQAARQIRSLPYTLSSPSEPTDAAFPCKCSSSGQRQRMAPAASAMSAQLLLDAGPKLFRVTPTCNNPANCGCRVRSHESTKSMGPHSHLLQPSRSFVTQPAAQAWCSTCSTLYLKSFHIPSCLVFVHALSIRERQHCCKLPCTNAASHCALHVCGAVPSITL